MSELYAGAIGLFFGFGVAGVMAMNGAWVTDVHEPVYTVDTINVTEYLDFEGDIEVECIIITGGDFAMAGPCVTLYQ